MGNSIFTPELCEALFQAPKAMASAIAWRASNPSTFLFQAKVLVNDGTVLDLAGYWCHNSYHQHRRWGFSLMIGGFCIRSYDMSRRHKNPANGTVRGPHKHRFQSSKILRFAYKPEPPIHATDPNQALMDFLREANIALPDDYQNVMFP